ncbi:N-acetylmuramoyl-L-alanine amidase [Quisquiliibacterium transsilvanicum]|uniref:N-acetylmuramoyl-L-alanine amidase AmiC n=1 Tax=Quisquiliibacterium transsilvanicum TaxID=1549638 RepID=A0A7W8HG18_9BURK|nr:N-acetylmuramoyl-L-alanine amidase [Quisquiliibacterium transsilvanicum]MBB5271442.1 N-acetylmuramoyl-L-alanine amidase [Quisquiliibacterium transsilvanicum]
MPERDRPGSFRGIARRRFVARSLAGAALALRLPAASAAGIVAVRVWPARDYTRVTLELDAALAHTHSMIPDPPRLVLDLNGLALDPTLRELVAKVRADDPYIAQVRVGQFRPDVVRLVFDLKGEVSPRIFTLPPIENYRHRLVLDLHPKVPVDPLKGLLADGGANADPIGALLRERAAPSGTPTAPSGPPTAPSSTPTAHSGSTTAPSGTAPAPEGPQASPAPPVAVPAAPVARSAPAKRPAGAAGTPRAPAVSRLVTIAIDPGHGGEDPGAIGRGGTREKDVVLAIARRLRARIAAEAGMRAYMTRDGDFFVPLATRVSKARQVQADLFVSIHADAFVNPRARGASVYVLSEDRASSSNARWLANRENRADLIGGVDLGGRNREVATLLLELSTTAQIRDSSNLGRMVLGQLGTVGDLHKPVIEKAGFAVLKAPDIPSILVETAFISNFDEERRLASRAYQDQIANAIFTGIRHYLIKYPPPGRATRA